MPKVPEISGLEYIDLCAVSWRCCRLWDLGQQRCVHSYAVHTDSVWTLASTPSFSHVYSGGKDLSVRERLHYLFTICVTMYLIWTPGTMHKTTFAIPMCLIVSMVSTHFLCIESCLLLNLLNTMSYIVVSGLCVLNAKKQMVLFVGVRDRFGYTGEHIAVYRAATGTSVDIAGRWVVVGDHYRLSTQQMAISGTSFSQGFSKG